MDVLFIGLLFFITTSTVFITAGTVAAVTYDIIIGNYSKTLNIEQGNLASIYLIKAAGFAISAPLIVLVGYAIIIL